MGDNVHVNLDCVRLEHKAAWRLPMSRAFTFEQNDFLANKSSHSFAPAFITNSLHVIGLAISSLLGFIVTERKHETIFLERERDRIQVMWETIVTVQNTQNRI